MDNKTLKPRKRLGRIRRVERIGRIVPIEGGEVASKSKSKVEKSKK